MFRVFCLVFSVFLPVASLLAKINYSDLGFYRVAAISPQIAIGDPEVNMAAITQEAIAAVEKGASIVLFPELSTTGYTVQDGLLQSEMAARSNQAIYQFKEETRHLDAAFILGALYRSGDGRLYNVAFVIAKGEIQGAVPKTYLPNYHEFYECRWFTSGLDVEEHVQDELLGSFHLGARQLFKLSSASSNVADALVFGVEICEDLWAPVKPSTQHALAGANVIFNLSASNELIGKDEKRKNLVVQQSEDTITAYVYASSGPTESVQDTVFGGDLIIAEAGSLLSRGELLTLKGGRLFADIDVNKIMNERVDNKSWGVTKKNAGYRIISLPFASRLEELHRPYPKYPFIPSDLTALDERARQIIKIQSTALARELKATRSKTAVVGISGGLDSTLALLVTVEAFNSLNLPLSQIYGITLPGMGTSEQTKTAAHELMKALGVTSQEISIVPAVKQHLKDIGHAIASIMDDREALQKPENRKFFDITYENAQARERTQILFDLSNKYQGLLVGTGDLSELCLGWCTFNGDHMASYSVNTGVPKTLVQHLIRWYSRKHPQLETILTNILSIEISPELIPPDSSGKIQSTESSVGPYVLNDFFIYHYLKNRFSSQKIFYLAKHVFGSGEKPDYSPQEIKTWLLKFFQRFYWSQFKRTTIPAGPKIGSVSISPRADLRFPNEASVDSLIKQMDKELAL